MKAKKVYLFVYPETLCAPALYDLPKLKSNIRFVSWEGPRPSAHRGLPKLKKTFGVSHEKYSIYIYDLSFRNCRTMFHISRAKCSICIWGTTFWNKWIPNDGSCEKCLIALNFTSFGDWGREIYVLLLNIQRKSNSVWWINVQEYLFEI